MINTKLLDDSVSKRIIQFILVIWFILAICFAFFDLEISKAVVEFDSIFGEFIADYGEIPGYLIIILAIMFNHKQLRENSSSFDKKLIIEAMLRVLILIWPVYDLLNILIPDLKPEILVISSIISIIAVQELIINKINLSISMDIKMTKFVTISILLVVISPLLFVQTIKYLWGRVRFRNLVPTYENFSPWYLPQGITGNKSFPSGHTAMGWMLLPLLILTKDINKKFKIILIFIVILWGFLVAIGRVIIGAHYASDVLFSTCFTTIVFLVLEKFYEKKISNNNELTASKSKEPTDNCSS